MSIHHNVAITLYYLSDEGRYRKVANAFGIGRSTVSTIIKEVAELIAYKLGPKLIKFPSTTEEVENRSSICFINNMDFLSVLVQLMAHM